MAVAVFVLIETGIRVAGIVRSEAMALVSVPSYSRAAFAPVILAVADVHAAWTCRHEALALFSVPSYSRAAFAPVLMLTSSLAFVKFTVS